MEIIDNFLNEFEFSNIKSLIMSTNFPWFFGTVVTGSKHTQFTHCFYQYDQPTHFYPQISFIREKLNVRSLVRIKANLNQKTEHIEEHDYHIDFPDMKTAIFYLNTCDGYTKFKNGEKVNSVENRIVIFDSNLEHTGTSCTNQCARLVINFNYF
jgi:hypothetical protein